MYVWQCVLILLFFFFFGGVHVVERQGQKQSQYSFSDHNECILREIVMKGILRFFLLCSNKMCLALI